MSDDKTVKSDAAASGKGNDSDDLNSLVKDWDDRSGNKKSAKKESDNEGFGVASEYLADKAISAVKGDLDIPDTFVRRHLLGQLNDDQEFQEAWFGQLEDRGRWEKALAKVTEEFQGQMKPKDDKKDDKAAKDDDKVAAAARSAREIKQPSGHSLDDVNWSELSTSDFEAKKQEVFRRAAAGTL